MRVRKMLWLVAFAGIILLLSQPVLGNESEADKSKSFYDVCLQNIIEKNENKTSRCDSKIEVIRKDSEIAFLKGAFYKNYKVVLVEEMIEMDITPKPQHVEHYLNKRFYELFRE